MTYKNENSQSMIKQNNNSSKSYALANMGFSGVQFCCLIEGMYQITQQDLSFPHIGALALFYAVASALKSAYNADITVEFTDRQLELSSRLDMIEKKLEDISDRLNDP
ncbi:hypothetical protein HN587_03320 [Candidatus Woesearchaeota archaeon]|jgi:hypothetical protein|nr:hypothetical protein [Candidatus Woesearchaeota archaeon]